MGLVFTQTDLDNVKAALVSGATIVKLGDRMVQYRSQDEILKLCQLIQNYLAGVTSTSDNPSMIQAGFSRDGE